MRTNGSSLTKVSMFFRYAGGLADAHPRPHSLRRLHIDDAGGAPARAARPALLRDEAAPDRARPRNRAQLAKDEVLALYLGLAPYGGNLEGIRAAALAYFGKEPRRLTLGEAAFGGAAAVPGSAASRSLRGNGPKCARPVLDRVAKSGLFATAEIERARGAGANRAQADAKPCSARRGRCGRGLRRPVVRLTIDGVWQAKLEGLARERARDLGPNISVAILAVDNASGDVLARVGSSDYFDEQRAGQVDMTRAWRSPGSTLKPFIYGLGFEDGVIHPETFIEDRPVRYGSYAPENFDLTFQGTVPVRKALQMSLNIPAVAVLDRVAPAVFRLACAKPAAHWLCLPAKRRALPWVWAASAFGSPTSSCCMPASPGLVPPSRPRRRAKCRRSKFNGLSRAAEG